MGSVENLSTSDERGFHSLTGTLGKGIKDGNFSNQAK